MPMLGMPPVQARTGWAAAGVVRRCRLSWCRLRRWGRLTGGDGKRHRYAVGSVEIIWTRIDDIHHSRIGAGRKSRGLRRDDNLIRFSSDGLGAAVWGIHPHP